ncbi:MAG TPA: DedA family protein [Longimicrobiaceae bacterium]|nr:DedA family protein [Longimicrobiaceae bacterium]
MESLRQIADYFLHLDVHLTELIRDYGGWTYGILFAIIFCETGLVVTPFLPGDSLLFATGALAAGGAMNVAFLWVLLCVAAVLGDSVNYAVGKAVGTRVFKPDARVLKTEYLRRTEEFYARYGGKTIIIARFIPIVRTYAPFVAGACAMNYARFITYNIIGGIVWITGFLFAGYFFGNIPAVKDNFGLVIIVIILLSVLPGVFEYVKSRRAARA